MPHAIARVEAAERRLFDRLALSVDSHVVELEATRLQVRTLEAGAGPPVVLLAGQGQVASHWAPLVARLDGVRTLACELPGFGLSQEINYHHADLRELAAGVVTDLLDAFALDRAVVLGHSAGGAAAVWAAAAVPQRVSGLGLLGCPDPAAPGSHLPAALVPVGLPGLDSALLDLPLPPFSVNRRMFQAVYGRRAVRTAPRELLQATHHAMDRPSFRPAMTSFTERAYGVRRAEDELAVTDEELAALQMPTLVVWGRRDRFGGVRVARQFASLLPNGRLEVVGAGHAPWLDLPEDCAALVGELLAAAAPDRHGRPGHAAVPE